MGAYLPTPVREKVSEDFESETLRFGASSMQGWRISQEDAHNCCPKFDDNCALFAVYDGHGGQEVAEYTAMKFPDFLKEFPAYKEGNIPQALEEAFLKFDASLTQESVIRELTDLAGVNEDEDSENDEAKECEELCEEADMPIEKLLERYGGPGGVPQSAASKAIKVHKEDFKSPVIKPKTDSPGLSSAVDTQSDIQEGVDSVKIKLDEQLVNGHSKSKNNQSQASGSCNDIDSTTDLKPDTNSDTKPTATDNQCSPSTNDESAVEGNGSETKDPQPIEEPSSSSSAGPACSVQSSGISNNEADVADCSEAGHAGGSSSSGGSGGSSNVQEEPSSSTGRTRKKRKGVIPEEDEDESSFDEDEETTDEEEDSDASGDKWQSGSSDDEEDEEGTMGATGEEECEEIMTGGEEPGSDSGCTAVVALLRNRELFVANAGDSRCVLCRGGKTVDMSLDHKPEDQIELDRITKAGGRVTMDGRVNGGLNLSRAIGDHVYKTNTDLPLKEQMITALPDVKSVTLQEDDEFMVLACDGIWNVMSSQDVVGFVRDRLKESRTVSSISEEMFEFCLAPDTSGDGSGCDNMTCVIVALDKYVTSESTNPLPKRPASQETGDTEGEPETKRPKL